MGNSQAKKRQIKVGRISGRLTKQDRQNLKDAFDRLQDRQVINDYQFRIEVLGPQVPDSIGLKLMQLFTSEEQIPEVLNFEDLLACYVVFKHGKPEEMGQICFEIMRMSSAQEYLSREHITLFVEKLDDLNEQQIQTFYAKTEFDPRLPIKKEEFVQAFKKVQHMPIFTWLNQLIEGYSKDDMNIDEHIQRAGTFQKQLTTLSQEKTKNETESMGFTSEEHSSMQEFFNREIKKSDAKEVLTVIQRLFKDVKNSRLKRYFVEALTKHKVLDYSYLTNLVKVICKENDSTKKLEFLFDLFSLHTDQMKRRQMRDFSEIFKLGSNFFQVRGQQVTKSEFLEDTSNIDLDFTIYDQTKYIIIAMMGLNPKDEQEEREAILAALNNNHNVEGYIQEHLDTEDTFYVIEKDFYEAWTMNVGFVDDKSYIIKKEKMNIIDNAALVELQHDLRMKDDVAYGDKFLLVPRFVFYPLSKWYKITKVIERKVINYQADKKKSLNLFKQRKSITGSRIIQGSSQQVPDPFFKTVGEVTYELEVYPKFFYYEKINDKGERPHLKALVNQKIDSNYMKKTLKSEKLPFFEMLASRKQNFEDILKDISATFKENYKRGRLWIEDQVISGAKLETTLEEYGIAIGQVIYAEYANQNNQWPTDKISAGPSSGNKTLSNNPSGNLDQSMKLFENMKTVGLYNLGNTCYMNSALQCLANTKFFFEYFIKEKRYMKQMNIKNKLGHQGELASNFAQLLQKMYQEGGRVAIPKEFKQAIATISEQFAGYDQQDSQEFLFFLLDGLHEELNLRLEKPYIENPNSDDRKIVELGLESWSNSLRREWSFIFFLFYGQLKSTLNCQKCNKISTTFDIFTNIPLSLPEPSKILLNVVIYRLPNEIKDMLQVNRPQSMLRRIDSARSDGLGLDRNQSQVDRNPSNIMKIQESLKYITNDQPIHIAIRVDKDAKIQQIIQEICEIKEVNIDIYQKTSNLILFSQIKGVIRGIFNPELRLSNYNLLNNEIEAIEVLNGKGRDTIREFYRTNKDMIEMMKTPHLTSLMTQSHKVNDKAAQQLQQQQNQSKKRKGQQQNQMKDSMKQRPKMDKCQIFNNYNIFVERYQDYEDNDEIPDEIYVVAYHRRFLKKQYYFFNPYQPQLLGTPIIFILPTKPSGKRIYEEVWAVAQNILKKSSSYHNKKNLWWEAANWKEKLEKREGETQQFKPFVLKTVDRLGYNCAPCSWMKICAGCIIQPTEDYIEDFAKQVHIAIEWNSQVIEDDYNPQANEVLHHQSTQDKQIIDEDQVNLEDCLRKFHEVEEINEKDQIHCGTCQSAQSHLKKLEIFRPPPILIVQLKRFKFNSQSRIKLNTYVDFPFYNLDVSTFVTDVDFLSQSGIEQKYDLYAMINHYGNLSFGHYISLVKNFADNKWYKYDDSARIPITEEQIQKDFAYILFYIRKDLQFKNLDDIMPSIKDLFPGKPIKTELGQGFVVSSESTNMFKVQFEKGKETQVVSKENIFEDQDNNELVFDAKEIEEIQIKKKEKLIEKQKLKQNKRQGKIKIIMVVIHQRGNKGEREGV